MSINNLAKNILSNIGGATNVDKFSHYSTRIRINSRDHSKVNFLILKMKWM
ncbi:PTS transporter subunit EIIB [Xenorhabdus sp. Flor]|uniref:PTS transporter subunit EIIB n=1 Tax=Xenorhabdus cabanillasii TaxID=351673 RepID=UPI00198CEC0C|nr:PTS transporter subunit EIIB [Xenorhabdus sp. Flor]